MNLLWSSLRLIKCLFVKNINKLSSTLKSNKILQVIYKCIKQNNETVSNISRKRCGFGFRKYVCFVCPEFCKI